MTSEVNIRLTLEDEILGVLQRNRVPLSSYLITVEIEERWKLQGRRGRILFWTFDAVVGWGALFKALDKLTRQGQLIRDQTPQADGVPDRITWRLVKS